MIIIGFTGTRQGLTDYQRAELKALLQKLYSTSCEFHHGDCIGADTQAHTIAQSRGYWIVIHPPRDPKARAFSLRAQQELPALPYLQRNQKIVNTCHHLVACPGTAVEELRSGTWATIRYARKKSKPTTIIYPQPSVQVP